MLMNINCSVISSFYVELKFDDGSIKKRTISTGDLIEIAFNYNGARKQVEGKVLKINAVGSDPRAWTILIDTSEDFGASQYRICPLNILDVDIIKPVSSIKYIESPSNYSNILSLRIVQGRLQYTQDGVNWFEPVVDVNNVIQDENNSQNDGEITD